MNVSRIATRFLVAALLLACSRFAEATPLQYRVAGTLRVFPAVDSPLSEPIQEAPFETIVSFVPIVQTESWGVTVTFSTPEGLLRGFRDYTEETPTVPRGFTTVRVNFRTPQNHLQGFRDYTEGIVDDLDGDKYGNITGIDFDDLVSLPFFVERVDLADGSYGYLALSGVDSVLNGFSIDVLYPIFDSVAALWKDPTSLEFSPAGLFLNRLATQGNTAFAEARISSMSQIPEPATLTLLGLGLSGLVGCGRRSRRS